LWEGKEIIQKYRQGQVTGGKQKRNHRPGVGGHDVGLEAGRGKRQSWKGCILLRMPSTAKARGLQSHLLPGTVSGQ
jgi:hypothetical protein